MKSIIKTDFTIAVVILIASVFIPPLFVINLILFVGQMIYHCCKNKDYNYDNDDIVMEETRRTINEMSDNIKKQTRELKDGRSLFIPSTSNHLVVGELVEFHLPNNYYFEDDPYLISYFRQKSSKIMMVFYNAKSGKEDVMVLSLGVYCSGFDMLKKIIPINFEGDILVDEKLQIRIFRTKDKKIFIERLIDYSLYVLICGEEHMSAMRKLISSFKKPTILKLTQEDKNTIYHFLKSVDNFSDEERDFVSYYFAEKRDLISKRILLNLMKNKKIKECDIDYLQEDKEKFYKCLNKYLNNKNAK